MADAVALAGDLGVVAVLLAYVLLGVGLVRLARGARRLDDAAPRRRLLVAVGFLALGALLRIPQYLEVGGLLVALLRYLCLGAAFGLAWAALVGFGVGSAPRRASLVLVATGGAAFLVTAVIVGPLGALAAIAFSVSYGFLGALFAVAGWRLRETGGLDVLTKLAIAAAAIVILWAWAGQLIFHGAIAGDFGLFEWYRVGEGFAVLLATLLARPALGALASRTARSS